MSLYREPTCGLRGCILDLIYSEEEGKYLPGFIVHDIVLVSLYSLWEDHFPQAHLSFMHQSQPIIHRTPHTAPTLAPAIRRSGRLSSGSLEGAPSTRNREIEVPLLVDNPNEDA